MKDKKVFEALGPIFQFRTLEINMHLIEGLTIGNIGIQLAADGRIWICLDGGSILRFKPIQQKKEVTF